MGMGDSLKNWVEKQSPGASEWLAPCQKFSDDDNVRALCLRMAEDYESGKIPVEEFMGSVSNLTGKDLDQIEQILHEISKPQQLTRQDVVAMWSGGDGTPFTAIVTNKNTGDIIANLNMWPDGGDIDEVLDYLETTGLLRVEPVKKEPKSAKPVG